MSLATAEARIDPSEPLVDACTAAVAYAWLAALLGYASYALVGPFSVSALAALALAAVAALTAIRAVAAVRRGARVAAPRAVASWIVASSAVVFTLLPLVALALVALYHRGGLDAGALQGLIAIPLSLAMLLRALARARSSPSSARAQRSVAIVGAVACAIVALTSASVLARALEPARRLRPLQRRCDTGELPACEALLREAPPDAARALAYVEGACDAGLGAACERLALLYEEPQFVDEWQSREHAFAKACRLGRETACAHFTSAGCTGLCAKIRDTLCREGSSSLCSPP